jgi:Ser/Thr protein kinase RdoA (MazF antagonist)
MDKEESYLSNWRQQLDEEKLLEMAAQRFGTQREAIRKLGGFENIVYRFMRDDVPCILRVTHDSRRTASEIEAELDWMHDLAEHGVRVARPLPSERGSLLEKVETELGTFLLAVFEEAPGIRMDGKHPGWGPELFTEWGYVTGQLHACARAYEPPAGLPKRMGFEMNIFRSQPIPNHMPAASLIRERLIRIEEQMGALSKPEGQYGMCHRDLHHGNFHVHEGRITAFDFDDCGYDHFVQDVAMAVYYASVMPTWTEPVSDMKQVSDNANRFLEHFMRGYDRAYSLDQASMKLLPLFIEKRRCELTMILLEPWGGDAQQHPGKREWIDRNVDSIRHDQPCMILDI